MAFGLSEITRWGLARLTGQQRTAGGVSVVAQTSGGVLLDAGGATVTPAALAMSTARLLGRSTAGTGAIEQLTLGTNLSLSGATLNATGGLPTGLSYSGNIFQQSNGTAAQRTRIFNTGDSTNGEWFDIDWQTTANVALIGTRSAGTGTARSLQIQTNGVTRMWFDAISNRMDVTGSAEIHFTNRAVMRASNPGIFTLGAPGFQGNALESSQMTPPAAPATNGYRIYADDNGGGKTRLMVRFATGAPQQLAIEP